MASPLHPSASEISAKKRRAAQMLAEGKSTAEIAEAVSVNDSTIWRWSKQDEGVRALVADLQAELDKAALETGIARKRVRLEMLAALADLLRPKLVDKRGRVNVAVVREYRAVLQQVKDEVEPSRHLVGLTDLSSQPVVQRIVVHQPDSAAYRRMADGDVIEGKYREGGYTVDQARAVLRVFGERDVHLTGQEIVKRATDLFPPGPIDSVRAVELFRATRREVGLLTNEQLVAEAERIYAQMLGEEDAMSA